jgi:hypothetical protein
MTSGGISDILGIRLGGHFGGGFGLDFRFHITAPPGVRE